MDDNRRAARRRAFAGGQVIFNHRHSTLSCLVRNLSESGARLEFDAPSETPDAFELKINGKDGEFNAEVVWRRGKSIGVKFLAARPPAASPRASGEDRAENRGHQV